MRFAAVALLSLTVKSSLAFVPTAKPASTKNVELNMLSHYSYDKPPHHPDYTTNTNNFVLDDFSGLSYEEAESLEEEYRVTEQLYAEELRQEEEAINQAKFEAEQEANQRAAEERAAIKAADEAALQREQEALEQARKERADRLAAMKAEQEKYYATEVAQQEQLAQEQQELTPEEMASYEMKSGLSSEAINKMVGLRGWRRMQFMDNTLDGTIIKRFPNKGPNHPDSRTNNKHVDMNEYYDMSMEDYQKYREECRLEARRIMGQGRGEQEALEAARADARLAAKHRGRIARETQWRLSNEEANNRIIMKRY